MAITRYAGDRFTVATADTKPTGVLRGAFLINTGNRTSYVKTGNSSVASDWVALQGGGGGGGSPSGDNFTVQFNDDGVFGGDADLTFTDGNRLNVNKLGISGNVYDSNNWVGEGGMILANEGATGVNWKNIESVLSGVGGSGVANYVARWSDEDTLTTGTLYDDGTKVGIGIIAPVAKLHIDDSAIGDNKALYIQNTNNTNDDSANIRFGFAGTDNANKGGIFFKRTASYGRGSLIFATENTATDDNVDNSDAKLTILADGKVGIGTDAPFSILHTNDSSGAIYHLTRTSGNTSGTLGVIRFGNTNIDSNLAGINAIQDGATDNAKITFTTQPAGGATTEQMVIKSDGKVGIGTTNPTQTLHSVASVGTRAARFDGVSGWYTTKVFGYNQLNNSYGTIIQAGTSSTDTAFAVVNAPGTSEYFRVKGDGNVGIGTTDPTEKLYVKDGQVAIYDSTASPSYGDGTGARIRVGRGAAENISFFINDTTNTIKAYQDADSNANHNFILDRDFGGTGENNFRIQKGGADQLIINYLGNVGIGTGDPTQKLYVVGSQVVEGGQVAIYDNTLNPTYGDGSNARLRVGRDSNQNISFRVDDYNNTITAKQDEVGAGYSHKFILDRTFDGTDANNFEIQKSGFAQLLINVDGNVGIGDNLIAPEHRLHVSGDAIISGYLYDSTNSTGTDGYVFTTKENGPRWEAIEDVLSGVGGNGTAEYIPRWVDSDTIGDSVIAQSGSAIGIGTAAPESLLHLAGADPVLTIRDTEANVANASAILRLAESTASDTLNNHWDIEFKGSAAGGDLVFERRGGAGATTTEVMRLAPDGNVGIGTTTLAATLHVHNSSTAAGKWTAVFCSDNQAPATAQNHDNVLIQASDVPCLKIYETASTPQVATFAVGDNNATLGSTETLRFFVNGSNTGDGHNGLGGTQAMHIKTDGNVGIGAVSPSVGLQVGNSVLNETKLVVFNSEGGVSAGLTVKSRTNRAKLLVQDNDSSAYVIAEGGKSSFGRSDSLSANNITVQTDGNVGIGQVNPGADLVVQDGQIWAGVGATKGYDFHDLGTGWGYKGMSDPSRLGIFTDANERITILTDGNVGIGTTNPGGRLETYVTAGGQFGLRLNSNFGGGNAVDFNPYISSVSNAGFSIDLAASTKLVIKSDGKVGIGTASPNNLLTASASHTSYAVAGGGAFIEVARTSGADAGFLINKDTGQWAIGIDNSDGANPPLKFEYDSGGSAHAGFTSGAQMALTYDGKVGIGTTAPVSQLQVGDGTDSNTWVGVRGAAGYYSGIKLYRGTGTWSNNSNNNFGITVTDFGMALGKYTDPGSNATGRVDYLTVDALGKVGIGTTAPAAPLHVVQTSGDDNDTGLIVETTDTSERARIVLRHGNAEDYVLQSNYYGFHIGAASKLEVINIERVTNHIGIGEDQPTCLFDIRDWGGNVDTRMHLMNTSQTSNGRVTDILFGKDNGNNLIGQLKYYYHTTQASRRIELNHLGENGQLTILDGGKVGIGIVAPEQLLHLKGAVPSILFTHDTNGYLGFIGDATDFLPTGGTAADTFGLRSEGAMTFGTNGNNFRAIIATDGKVGIGTTAPTTAKLVVQGADAGDMLHLHGATGTNTRGLKISLATGGATNQIVNFDSLQANGILAFKTAGVERMRIHDGGNVGIGTTNPGHLLHVNGDLGVGASSATTAYLYMNSTTRNKVIVPTNGALELWDGVGRRLEVLGGATNGVWIANKLAVGGNTVIAPEHTLHVAGDAIISGVLYDSTNSSGVSGHVLTSEVGGPQWKMIEDVLSGVGGNGTAEYIPRWTDSDTIGDSVMAQSGSAIGIGTAAPSVALHIAANAPRIKLEDTLAPANYSMVYADNGQLILSADEGQGQASSAVILKADTTEGLRVIGDGNVGIGTDAPSGPLHIATDSSAAWTDGSASTLVGDLIITNADDTNNNFSSLVFGSKANVEIYTGARITARYPDHAGANPSAELFFETKNDDGYLYARMCIDRDGKVGIGTTAPGATLTLSDGTDNFDFDVTENALTIKTTTADAADDQAILIDAGNGGLSSTRGAYIHLHGNEHSLSAGKAIYQCGNLSTSAHLFRKGGGIDAAIITSDGNVGIGQNFITPQHKLHVSGDAIISGVLYDSTNSTGTDGYVFTTKENGPRWEAIEDVLSGVGGNGTAEYIPRWTDSDTLGNSIIHDDGTHVGVGTSAGEAYLMVEYSNNNTGTWWTDSSAGLNIYNTHTNPGAGPTMKLRGADARIVYGENGSSDKLTFSSRQSQDTVAETITFDNNGKVGIGTAAPGATLDVNGSAIVRGVLHFDGTASSYIDNASSKIKIGGDAGVGLWTYVGGWQERLTVLDDGNVGIGTTAPATALDVVGEITGLSSAYNTLTRATANTTGATSILSLIHNTSGTPAAGFGSRFVLGSETSTTASQTQVMFDAIWTNVTHATRTSDLVVQTVNSGTLSEKFRITGAGNVGIGTDAPERHLHVKGADTVPAVIMIQGGKDTVTSAGEINARLAFASNDGSVAGSGSIGGAIDSITELSNGAWTGLAFSTYSQPPGGGGLEEHMRIAYNGNVGIGTDGPGTLLHLRQYDTTGPTITMSNNPKTGYINWWGAAGGAGDRINEFEVNAGAAGYGATIAGKTYVRFKTDGVGANDERMRIVSDGNVGIGTTSPAALLHVSAGYVNTRKSLILTNSSNTPFSGTTYDSVVINQDDVPCIRMRETGNSANVELTFAVGNEYSNSATIGTTGMFKFATNRSVGQTGYLDQNTRMVILADGNVGIGTDAPDVRLQVEDSAAGGNVDVLQLTNTSNSANSSVGMEFFSANARFAYIRGIRTSDSSEGILTLGVRSGGSETDTLHLKGGSVGIGTTAPAYTLDVQGNIGRNSTGTLVIQGGNSASNDYTQTNLVEISASSINPNQPNHGGNARVASIQLLHHDLAGSASSGSIKFYTSPTNNVTAIQERLVIKSDGNVGIGTDNPGMLVDAVGGQIGASVSGGSSHKVYLTGDNSNCTLTSSTGLLVNGTGIRLRSSASTLYVNDNNTQNVSLVSGGGKVGIGTTSPEGTLHVETGSAGTITTEAYADDLIIENSDHVGIALRCPDAKDGFILFQSATNDRVAIISAEYNGGDENLAFAVDDDVKMTINDSGHVGIGTATPNSLFQLDAGAHLDTNYGQLSMFGGMYWNGSAMVRSAGGTRKAAGMYMGTGGDFFFITAPETSGTTVTLSDRLVIKNDGKVGITSSNPSTILSLGGSLATGGIYINSGVDEDHTIIDMTGITGGGKLIWDDTEEAFSMSKGLRVTAGKVGIGTTNPGKLLHVRKDQAAETTLEIQNNTDATNAGTHLQMSLGGPNSSKDVRITMNVGNSGADWALGVDNSDSDKFKISGGTDSHAPALGTNDRLTIKKDGDVGIGTPSPNTYGYTTATVLTISDPTDHANNRGILELESTKTTPADGDYLGAVAFISKNNAGSVRCSNIFSRASGSSGSGLGGKLYFATKADGGAEATRLTVGADGTLDLVSAKLKINGGGGTAGYHLQTDGSGNISWQPGGAGTVTGTGTDNYVPRWNGTTALQNSAIFSNDSGSVGIGNTGPAAKLHVFGDWETFRLTRDQATDRHWDFKVAANGYLVYQPVATLDGANAYAEIRNLAGASKVRFATSGDSYFTGGKVGIGTTAPGAYKLRVEGDSIATGDTYIYNNKALNVLDSGGQRSLMITNHSSGSNSPYFSADPDNQAANTKMYWYIDAAEKMSLDSGGSLSIQGTLTEASSIAIKENVETYTPSLEIINKLRPVRYNKKKSKKKEVGLVAEELAEIFPELVERDEKGNPSGVNYSRAVAVLLHGFKELYKEVKELKEKI